MTSVRAVVFDFDGTILDTETPVYESWASAFRFAGVEPVPLHIWLQSIGKADNDALDLRSMMCDELRLAEVPVEVEEHRRSSRDEMLAGQPIRPGVQRWIEAAVAAKAPLAIASSSPTDWVRPHLERIGLAEFFAVFSCADPGTPGKPDPFVYARACADLGVAPSDAIAIEDSTHGVTAAITAGLRCIAAPGPITKTMNFSHATLRTDDLSQVDPTDWL